MSGSVASTGVNIVLMLYLFAGSCIYDEMKYIYIDESGTPSHRDKRSFIVAIVLFGSLDEVNEMREKIIRFKRDNDIPQDYEFHYSRNTNTKRKLFIEFLKKEIRNYEVFVSAKDEINPLQGVASAIACFLRKSEKYRIFIDENPRLYVSLRVAFKEKGIAARISQAKSKSESLIQVADYIAGMESKNKALRKPPRREATTLVRIII